MAIHWNIRLCYEKKRPKKWLTYLTFRKLNIGVSKPVVATDEEVVVDGIDTLDSPNDAALGDHIDFNRFYSCENEFIKYTSI